MAKVYVTDSEIKSAVGVVLKDSNWPLYRVEDDRGLEEYEYFEFCRDVLRKLGIVNSFESCLSG